MAEEEKSRVLIVDDEFLNLKILTSILSDDHVVSVAPNGAQALIVAKQLIPDLILLDIMMPEMDGYEVCRRLKNDTVTQEIPVIFLTSITDVEGETEGFSVGAVDYIAKPYNPILVKARVSTHIALVKQHRITERLLANTLPNKIIQELKATGEAKPESFENVSLLFADIVSFTKASSQLSAEFLIGELSDIYTAFDEIVDKHECERIKTIGDAYFAVSGIPEPNSDHAVNMVRAGLAFIQYLHSRNESHEQQWDIRVGIHTGNVVGGIVGTKKYLYDVFGDAVNMASRIENATKPMQVGISSTTYNLVKDELCCTPQGLVHLKGKGEENLWFVDAQ
ncbi:MAG: response regulator [Xanthomonadales bacterium]|nr:response regulator [Xanthomonadales bacterium]